MKKFELLNEFKENLERFENHSFKSIYKMLFKLLGDETMEAMLKNTFNDYKKDKENWFAIFHKSIRTCDIFTELHAYKVVDKLTDEQKNRRDELLKIREVQYNQFKKENPDEDIQNYKEFIKQPERKETLIELRKLNSIKRSEEEVSINGKLDAILYSLIAGDSANELYFAMERTFKICI